LKRYLLDTNHLSAYLDRHPVLEPKIDAALRAGDRFGICLPVLCEYRAGIGLSRRYRQNLARLQSALGVFRLWPIDEQTAADFADLFRALRSAGQMLAQFDLLIAAAARQHKLSLLTSDRDFQAVVTLGQLTVENWL
jgi:predicted nucleic acid-binding protein